MTSKWESQFSGFASGARPDDITLVPYPFHSEPQILETAEGTMKKLGLLLVFVASLSCFGQLARPTIYVEPQQGFETYLAAAILKKNVPVDVVMDETKANYVLKAAPVEIKTESTGGKIARCLFAYCAGIEDKGNVFVQLIQTSSSKVMRAYSVNKQKGGSKNAQAMAEAVAKTAGGSVERTAAAPCTWTADHSPHAAQMSSDCMITTICKMNADCSSGATYPQSKLVRHNPESATNLSRGHTTRRERNVNLRVVKEGMFRARQFETRTIDHDHC